MAPPSYSLSVVTANLIERLEGARRTWSGAPDDARAGLLRIAEETVDAVVAEHDQLLGDDGSGTRLRREVLETFLPRYTRLALDHNELEDQGYHAWRKGDPVARLLATSAALLVAMVLTRVVHHPVVAVFYAVALLVPFLPEIRGAWYRHKYRKELQAVVDDMARIQDELDRYALAGPTEDATDRRPNRRSTSEQTDNTDEPRPRPPPERDPAR